MTAALVILALVFVVLTAMIVSKTQSIIKGVKKDSETSESDYLGAPDGANTANAAGLLIFWIICIVGIIWSFMDAKKDFLPEASSEHGKETDYWFWVSMIVIMIAFVLVNTALFLFAYLYRYKPNNKVSFYPHNNKLEVIWTAVPAVVMAGLVFTGLNVWNKVMDEAPAESEVIEIMGKQFGWTVRYPGVGDNKLGKYNYKLMDDAAGNSLGVDFTDENSLDDFANVSEMHIPKGKPVLLKIRARDVLHSVFIPHMRVKMDAVPGMPTKFWFKPEKSTDDMRSETGNPNFNYEIACTEICGRSHFGMKLLLVVDEPEEYAKWKASQKTILAENPDLMAKVPDNLKPKAMRYLPAAAPAAPVDSASAMVSGGGSSKVYK
ncbi:MAG: cytochrome c oxidase subunit II [Leadbetterella sp.]